MEELFKVNYWRRNNSIILRFAWKSKKLYEKMFQSTAAEMQLTQNEIDVLLFLHNNKQLDTAKDIADYRSLSKSMISKSVDSLINRGYLSYMTDENDKRCIHLKLQPAANLAVQKLLKIQSSYFKILSNDITMEESQVLNRVLDKLYKNISDELEK